MPRATDLVNVSRELSGDRRDSCWYAARRSCGTSTTSFRVKKPLLVPIRHGRRYDQCRSAHARRDGWADICRQHGNVQRSCRRAEGKTEVIISAELFSQAQAAFGLSGLGQTVVLDEVFNNVELVGVPLSIGNYVQSQGIGGLFSQTNFTYSPYIRLGDGDTPGDDTIIRGIDYQEHLLEFSSRQPASDWPVYGRVVPGARIERSARTTSVPKTLYDRIGFAVRQTGSAVSISTGSTPKAAILPLDITTFQVSTWLESPAEVYRLNSQLRQSSALTQQLAADLDDSDPAFASNTQLSQ